MREGGGRYPSCSELETVLLAVGLVRIFQGTSSRQLKKRGGPYNTTSNVHIIEIHMKVIHRGECI